MLILKLTEIENSTDLCEHPSMPEKMGRRPSVISKIISADSDFVSKPVQATKTENSCGC